MMKTSHCSRSRSQHCSPPLAPWRCCTCWVQRASQTTVLAVPGPGIIMRLAVPDKSRPANQASGRKAARRRRSQNDVAVALHDQLHCIVRGEQRRVLRQQGRGSECSGEGGAGKDQSGGGDMPISRT